MAMQPLKPAIGLAKALWIKAFAISKNSMSSNHIDACKCLLQFQTANKNANSAGET